MRGLITPASLKGELSRVPSQKKLQFNFEQLLDKENV